VKSKTHLIPRGGQKSDKGRMLNFLHYLAGFLEEEVEYLKGKRQLSWAEKIG